MSTSVLLDRPSDHAQPSAQASVSQDPANHLRNPKHAPVNPKCPHLSVVRVFKERVAGLYDCQNDEECQVYRTGNPRSRATKLCCISWLPRRDHVPWDCNRDEGLQVYGRGAIPVKPQGHWNLALRRERAAREPLTGRPLPLDAAPSAR